MVTSDSRNSGHSQYYENKKLCILVDPVLRNSVTKSNFLDLKKKKDKKKALALKGVRVMCP